MYGSHTVATITHKIKAIYIFAKPNEMIIKIYIIQEEAYVV